MTKEFDRKPAGGSIIYSHDGREKNGTPVKYNINGGPMVS